MKKVRCFTGSSIGPCPTLADNFDMHPEQVSIHWDDDFDFSDDAWFRVHHQCDVPEMVGGVEKLIDNHKWYDLILAWDQRVLSECPNSVFLTESACSWMPRKNDGSIDPLGNMNYGDQHHKNPVVLGYERCDINKKEFAISFLTSSKNVFPGHILRQEIYRKLPDFIGNLRIFKHRSPPIWDDKRTLLEPYMFHICPENSRHNNYYSEKIVDCFIAKTVPIYYGCPNIDAHFDPKGLITFTDYEELYSILTRLTTEDYLNRLTAVESNFHKALKGVHQWSLIENYIAEGIAKKHAGLIGHINTETKVERQRLRRPLR